MRSSRIHSTGIDRVRSFFLFRSFSLTHSLLLLLPRSFASAPSLVFRHSLPFSLVRSLSFLLPLSLALSETYLRRTRLSVSAISINLRKLHEHVCARYADVTEPHESIVIVVRAPLRPDISHLHPAHRFVRVELTNLHKEVMYSVILPSCDQPRVHLCTVSCRLYTP